MKKRKSITRRTFVKVLPAAGAAAIVAAKAPLNALAQTPTPTPQASPSATPAATRAKKDDLKDAERIIGIDFNEKEEDMALPGVNRTLDIMTPSGRSTYRSILSRPSFFIPN